jgi:hypothetical protein
LNFPVHNTVFSNKHDSGGGSPMQCTFTPTYGTSDVQWPRNHVAGDAPDTQCVDGIALPIRRSAHWPTTAGRRRRCSRRGSSPLRGAGRELPATDQRGSRATRAVHDRSGRVNAAAVARPAGPSIVAARSRPAPSSCAVELLRRRRRCCAASPRDRCVAVREVAAIVAPRSATCRRRAASRWRSR